jgi:hypothetical protein
MKREHNRRMIKRQKLLLNSNADDPGSPMDEDAEK